MIEIDSQQTPPSQITPGNGSFDDRNGNTYSIDANENSLQNGWPIPNGGYTAAMTYHNDAVYGRDSVAGSWWVWNQEAWIGPVETPIKAAAVVPKGA